MPIGTSAKRLHYFAVDGSFVVRGSPLTCNPASRMGSKQSSLFMHIRHDRSAFVGCRRLQRYAAETSTGRLCALQHAGPGRV
jgi:hypothetical protein